MGNADDDDVGSSTTTTTRKAVRFDRSLVGRMTPTMRAFTLEGKVVVVTGYVDFCCFVL